MFRTDRISHTISRKVPENIFEPAYGISGPVRFLSKKILRKLVLGNIIISNTGKEGGFQLTPSIEEISVYDIYNALEGEKYNIKSSGIGKMIFKYSKGFERANASFGNELKKCLSQNLLTRKTISRALLISRRFGLSILSVRDSDEAEKIMREAPYVKQLGASYKVIQRDPKFGEFK